MTVGDLIKDLQAAVDRDPSKEFVDVCIYIVEEETHPDGLIAVPLGICFVDDDLSDRIDLNV